MGLESAQSPLFGPKVENYVNLFRDVELCRSTATSVVMNVVLTVCLLLGARLVAH